ncbi:MAG: transposase [Planctomycetota bacterium]
MIEEEKKLKERVGELTKKASEVDEAEDGEHGESRGDELPDELARAEKRLKAIQEAKARLEERQKAKDSAAGRSEGDDQKCRRGRPHARSFGTPPDKAQDNFTDPESRIMKSAKGYVQGYNAQIGVDRDSQLIVATQVTEQASDFQQLIPVLDRTKLNFNGVDPKRVLADAGYCSEANLQELERRCVDGYVAIGRGEKGAKKKINDKHRATKRMAKKMNSERGKKRYRERKWVAEAPFGWIKSAMGFRQFSVRGKKKAAGEFSLVAFVVNLRRMNQLITWT